MCISSGYLKFWHAILIDLGSLVLVVANGTKLLRFRGFEAAYTAVTAGGASALSVNDSEWGLSKCVVCKTSYNPIQQT